MSSSLLLVLLVVLGLVVVVAAVVAAIFGVVYVAGRSARRAQDHSGPGAAAPGAQGHAPS